MEEPTKPFFQYNYIEMCNTGSAGNEKENWVSGSRDKTTTIAEGEFNYSRMEPEIEPGDQLLLFPDDIHAHVSQYRHTLTQPRKAIWSDIDSYSVLWPYTFPLLQDSLCISKHSLFSGLWSLLWLDNNSGTRMRPKPGFFYAYSISEERDLKFVDIKHVYYLGATMLLCGEAPNDKWGKHGP